MSCGEINKLTVYWKPQIKATTNRWTDTVHGNQEMGQQWNITEIMKSIKTQKQIMENFVSVPCNLEMTG